MFGGVHGLAFGPLCDLRGSRVGLRRSVSRLPLLAGCRSDIRRQRTTGIRTRTAYCLGYRLTFACLPVRP